MNYLKIEPFAISYRDKIVCYVERTYLLFHPNRSTMRSLRASINFNFYYGFAKLRVGTWIHVLRSHNRHIFGRLNRIKEIICLR